MGLRSYFGLGSGKPGFGSSSRSGDSGSVSAGGWYSPHVPLPQVREVHPEPAKYNPDGTRQLSPKPDPAHVNRSFWRD